LSTSSQPASLLRWQAGRLEVASTTKLCRVAVPASLLRWQAGKKIATNRRLQPIEDCYQKVSAINKLNVNKLFYIINTISLNYFYKVFYIYF
jgi:hypothetical protein